MEKRYVDIDEYVKIPYNIKFGQMVQLLLAAKEKGDLVSCSFNGHMFYSDKITEDSAYLEYYDMTKEEFERYRNNRKDIAFDLLANGVCFLCIPDELYKDYVKTIIQGSGLPDLLQVYEYVIKNVYDTLVHRSHEQYIERFNAFDESRKTIARDFINKFFNDDYRSLAMEMLNLTETKESTK